MLKRAVGRFVIVATLLATCPVAAEQRADPDFHHTVERPAYPSDQGPIIAVDAGHRNFLTADGRFAPFSALAREDGFEVRSIKQTIDADTLAGVDIFVIANARLPKGDRTATSAFTEQEILEVHDWVKQGGALLLIADHVPFSNAAQDLGSSFGFAFTNGFAFDVDTRSTILTFSRDRGLDLSPIGDQQLPEIYRVMTFTGQAIKIPPAARSVLTLAGKYAALVPTIPGRLDQTADVVDVSGYSQGAVMQLGQGKVAVFGEGGAFSAQISESGDKLGMNVPGAEENAIFVLKVLRWLAN